MATYAFKKNNVTQFVEADNKDKARKQFCKEQGWSIEKISKDRLYLFAHNALNYVKVGDKVKKGDRVGTIGTANGNFYAHLHLSVSEGLTVNQIFSYVRFWTLDKVKKYYLDPRKYIDKKQLFKLPIDEGHRGWGFLQKMGWRYYHPGIDYNGLGGGNTDFGYRFYSPIDGTVVYSGNRGGKWGNCVIIKEK